MGTLSRVGLVVLVPLLMVAALLTPQLARGSRLEISAPGRARVTEAAPTDVITPNEVRDQEIPEVDDPLDLYGNEITEAVARYKFDATGSLYETHSPQTELPRLASPKS